MLEGHWFQNIFKEGAEESDTAVARGERLVSCLADRLPDEFILSGISGRRGFRS